MFGISGGELAVILLLALVVLGPDRLPVVARKAGQVMGELRKVSSGFEAEMRTAMFENDRPTPPRPVEERSDGPVSDSPVPGPVTADRDDPTEPQL